MSGRYGSPTELVLLMRISHTPLWKTCHLDHEWCRRLPSLGAPLHLGVSFMGSLEITYPAADEP